MSWHTTLLTIACVLGISVGQILFKRAAMSLPSPLSVATLVSNGWLLTALVIYALATLGWILVLRKAPLALAYPLFALAFLFVPVLSHFLFAESLTWRTWVGGALILIGVWIASHSS